VNARGETTLVVLVVLAVAGLGWITVPKWLDKRQRQAEASQQATMQLLEAQRAQGASAAAGVTQIATANALAPESPARAFIAREADLTLTKLPAPAAAEVAQAEARRLAVMEGRLNEANRLYVTAHERADQLARDLARAVAAREAADRALLEAAAAARAAERTQRIMMGVAALVGVLWLYAYLTRLGPSSLGKIAADIRGGSHPVAALDFHVPDWLKPQVRRAAKLEMEIKD
jgi:hypothetical protein